MSIRGSRCLMLGGPATWPTISQPVWMSLARAGADFGFIAANTPHLVFDEVQRRSAIPLLSIVRVTCDHTKALGLKKVGLFGTGFTMRASFYPEEFQRAGIALVRPKESEQEFIHGKYIGELLNNRFLPETRTEILNIAQRMRSEDGIEAVSPRRHGASVTIARQPPVRASSFSIQPSFTSKPSLTSC